MAKKIEIPESIKHRYFIKKPTGRRRTFGVFRRGPDGDTTLRAEEIDVVNEAYLAGSITGSQAYDQLTLYIESRYRQDGATLLKVVSNKANYDQLSRLFDANYATKKVVDRASAYNDYRRAVEVIGELSLATASQRDLQLVVNKNTTSNTQQRRVVARLNTIFKWLARDIRLMPHKREFPVVRYLTSAEFERVACTIQDEPFKVMCQMAFYSGCRIGELFALDRPHLKKNYLYVGVQLDGEGNLRETKNRKRRHAYLFPEARALFRRWLELKDEVTPTQRHKAASIFKWYCKRVFPRRKDKHLVFHDLRHSYAIQLCEMGAPLKTVANCLGNSEKVCEEHYLGFLTTDFSMDALEQIVVNQRRSS